MGRDEVVRGIARGRYGPDDRLSAVGGEESAIADHPEFRAAFIPGSELDLRIEAIRAEAEAVHRRAKIGTVVRYIAASGLLAFSLGAVWFSTQSRALVLPESAMVKLEEQIKWWQAELNEEPRYAPVPRIRDLPHNDWIEANRAASDAITMHQGRVSLWWSSYRQLEGARRSFLAAGARSPLDPAPMVGLILVDAQMLHTRPELLGEIARAQTRIDSLRARGPSVAAAEGARLLAQGQRSGAAQVTEPFIEDDIMCRLIHGQATTNPTTVLSVVEAVDKAPLSLRALASVAYAAEDWPLVRTAADLLIESDPSGPDGHEVQARLHAEMGDWTAAAQSAMIAVDNGSERADMLHTVAVTKMRSVTQGYDGTEWFDRLVEHPHLAGHTNRQTVLVQGAQNKVMTGDLAGARQLIEAAMEAEENDPNAAMVMADILYKDGNHGEAEAVLRATNTSELEARYAAVVHLWAARLYLEMNKQRLARTELEEAERLAPDWPLVVEERAWAAIDSGDLLGAASALERMVFLHPFRVRVTNPLKDASLLPPKSRRLGKPILTAMEGDVRYEALRVTTAAILAWRRNRPGHYDQLLDAVEQDADHLALNGAVAFAALEAGDWERAERHSIAVVSRRPSLGVMHSVRGIALSKMGKFDEARDPLNRSTKTDVGRPVLLRLAAEVFAENGDVSTATELLEEAQKSDPEDTRIRSALFALTDQKK